MSVPSDAKESKDIATATSFKKKGKVTAAYVEVTSKKHEKLARNIGKVVDYVILVGKDWKVIPLENVIADLQGEKAKIIAAVSDVDEAKVALETLEHGADGILIQPSKLSEIKEFVKVVEDIEAKRYDLKTAKITKIKPVGSGDRVCIDTCSLMNIGEGMLVGSYSHGFFLVHSETLESEYVEARPFRVNAGPVHAYIMMPNHKTKYLSELKSGDEVLIVDSKGNGRKAIVGRVKIEKRPLLLIEAECEGMKIATLLQNAETIRLVNEKGKPVSVSELKEGDKVLVHIEESARHFGMAIKESIIEK